MDPTERKQRINIILQEWDPTNKSVKIKIYKKAKKNRPRIVKIYLRTKKPVKKDA
jgi:hypothetical protein